jgi:hypothetical protein
MRATLLTGALVSVALVFANPTLAQVHPTSPAPALAPVTIYDHASTWEEGVLRGRAETARAFGEMNYNNSLALVNAQEAYSRYLDNRLKAVTTYFDLRKVNREARAEERGQRPTPEALTRLAKTRLPDRLAAHQWDASGTRPLWPVALDDPLFAVEREAIDELMAHREGAEEREIQRIAAAMTDKLRTQVHAMNPGEYIAAKRFLTSLRYEMNFAPGSAALAVR